MTYCFNKTRRVSASQISTRVGARAAKHPECSTLHRSQAPQRQQNKRVKTTACKATIVALPQFFSSYPWIHTLCHTASAAIILVACARNMPQIARCWRARSSTGISMAALATEVSCYACIVAYGLRSGYALTIWGSEMACYIQDAALLALTAYLRGIDFSKAASVACVALCIQFSLFTELVPLWCLAKFQALVGVVLGLGARVPQILLNMRNGHTGNLSAATFSFNATANTVCFLSAAVLTGDIYIMATQVWMFTLNCTILSQIFASKNQKSVEKQASSLERKSVASSEEEFFPWQSVEIHEDNLRSFRQSDEADDDEMHVERLHSQIRWAA